VEENKTEKLKAVLNKTFTSEDIENKLKQSMQIKEDIPSKKENKPLQTPKKHISYINILIYILSIVIIFLLFVAIYLFVKSPTQKEVIKQIPKEVIKEIKVEVEKEKIVDLNNTNFNKYYNALKFNTLKCYNFKKGDSILTKKCQDSINDFLKQNKDAIRFEILPVVADDDNIIFEKIKPKIQEFEKSFKDKVEEYILRGLSRQRVLEATEYIKNKFGEKVIITPTNYYVKSVKNNKGIIIKAYYSKD
jgi:REP element-mobilizing transposase RayT